MSLEPITTLLNKTPDIPVIIPKARIIHKDFWSIFSKTGIFSRLGKSPKTRLEVIVADMIVTADVKNVLKLWVLKISSTAKIKDATGALKATAKPDDAADALSVALCHVLSQRFKQQYRMN